MTRNYEKHRLEWNGITIDVQYCRTWLDCYDQIYGYPLANLTIEAVDPERAPLPITETGSCSHFTRPDEIDAVGGPGAFVCAALDEAAQDPAWLERQAAARQVSLF